jgi:hypothetical protein
LQSLCSCSYKTGKGRDKGRRVRGYTGPLKE